MGNEEKLNSAPANMQIEESRDALIIRYKWNNGEYNGQWQQNSLIPK